MYREILKICGRLKNRIDVEKSKVIRYKELISNLTSELDGLPRGENFGKSKVENIAAAIVDSEQTISALVEIKANCILELREYLTKKLKNQQASAVLLYRYGFCLMFREIATRLKYSERNIYNLHSAGLEELKKFSVALQ